MTHIPTPAAWAAPLAAWLAWLAAAGIPNSTIKLRSYQLRRLAHELGCGPWDVDAAMLTSWLAQQTWAANTRRSWRSTLRSFWAWAAQAGHVASSPAAALPTVPQHIGTPRPAPEQVVQTGTSITDTRVRLMIRLAAWAGLRCCEICRVHTDDLEQDLVGWSLRVLGKGSKIRVVPLPRRLALELRSQDAGWVFPGKIDGHLSAHRVSELISAALPVGVTAHMLRHRFASATYQTSGHDIRAVQELLGHSSVATTQIYTAIQSDALRRAVEGAAA